jgi:hypothetical protein
VLHVTGLVIASLDLIVVQLLIFHVMQQYHVEFIRVGITEIERYVYIENTYISLVQLTDKHTLFMYLLHVNEGQCCL